MKKKLPKANGKQLATMLGAAYVHLGKVWAQVDGRYIVLRGDSLPPHPDLRHLYPNGWCLLQKFTFAEAKRKIGEVLR